MANQTSTAWERPLSQMTRVRGNSGVSGLQPAGEAGGKVIRKTGMGLEEQSRAHVTIYRVKCSLLSPAS